MRHDARFQCQNLLICRKLACNYTNFCKWHPMISNQTQKDLNRSGRYTLATAQVLMQVLFWGHILSSFAVGLYSAVSKSSASFRTNATWANHQNVDPKESWSSYWWKQFPQQASAQSLDSFGWVFFTGQSWTAGSSSVFSCCPGVFLRHSLNCLQEMGIMENIHEYESTNIIWYMSIYVKSMNIHVDVSVYLDVNSRSEWLEDSRFVPRHL